MSASQAGRIIEASGRTRLAGISAASRHANHFPAKFCVVVHRSGKYIDSKRPGRESTWVLRSLST